MSEVDLNVEGWFADSKALKKDGCVIQIVGSRTIDGAAQDDSDFDFLVHKSRGEGVSVLPELGYDLELGNEHYEPADGKFNSWRKGKVNIIYTNCDQFYQAFQKANALCKALKLLNRDDRVTVFQAILYNNYPGITNVWDTITFKEAP
jgi:hypothetical protein